MYNNCIIKIKGATDTEGFIRLIIGDGVVQTLDKVY
jgi:hypothetical protein